MDLLQKSYRLKDNSPQSLSVCRVFKAVQSSRGSIFIQNAEDRGKRDLRRVASTSLRQPKKALMVSAVDVCGNPRAPVTFFRIFDSL
jgi:hypothetical protein